MTPRKSQPGAPASARKAPVHRRARGASSSDTSVFAPAPRKTSAPKKSRPRKDASWFRWWLLPPLVGLTIAVLVAMYYPVAQVQYKETRERAALQAELKAMQDRNSRLAVEVARLKTNEGVEDYARSQLGMVKRGEHVVVVTDSASGRSTASTSTETCIDGVAEQSAEAPKGAWTEFLDAVFGVQ